MRRSKKVFYGGRLVIMVILVECLGAGSIVTVMFSCDSPPAPSSMVLHKYLLKQTSYRSIGVVERLDPQGVFSN